ncbi:ATP-binding protein [Undibacterium danionis]|uniref:histidine kinase n=1 Tax=Undibacterium danionis TaxID=1812100 RepID=A0ABV6I9Z4_9BURK
MNKENSQESNSEPDSITPATQILNRVNCRLESTVSINALSNDVLSNLGIELAQFLDSTPICTIVIDMTHTVTHWNKAAEFFLGYSRASMIGTSNQWRPFYGYPRPILADLILDREIDVKVNRLYQDRLAKSSLIDGAYHATDFFPNLGENGLWLHFTAAPLFDRDGKVMGAIEILEDITERREAQHALEHAHTNLERLVIHRTNQLKEANSRLESDLQYRQSIEHELMTRNAELMKVNQDLSSAQDKLMQSEKMASIGQLAAGVAHEINNPIGYIFSNIGSLEKYVDSLFEMLRFYESIEHQISSVESREQLKKMKEQFELAYLVEDIPELIEQSKEGIDRVRKIVQDLKDFSRVDSNLEWQWVNLHPGFDSTLNVVNNEVKYKADVVKNYGDIPDIECLPSQINQVLLNLVVNASHAMGDERGTITLTTSREDDHVIIKVEDNGSGIPPELLTRIFDPFFTTKPIGKGTGLGLSLSYGIVKKHHGELSVESRLGIGTCFKIRLPIQQSDKNITSESQ